MENPYELHPAVENVLEDFEINLQQASTGKRFANWLIDVICFYILSFFYGMTLPLLVHEGLHDPLTGKLDIKYQLLVYVIYFLYYIIMESAFKGKTVGKYITGTRAVQDNGSPITFRTALLRTLCRCVPFEIFSALGSPSYPWHDRWTDTYVIDEAASTMPAEA